MQLLFAISVVCFCSVLWIALSLARRIRRDQMARRRPAAQPQSREFFEDGEFRTPRSLRLHQQVAPATSRRASQSPLAVAIAPRSGPKNAEPDLQPSIAAAPSIYGLNTLGLNTVMATEARVVEARLQFVAVDRTTQPVKSEPASEPAASNARTDAAPLTTERKSPQPARSSTFRRVDLSHYNRDMGDLTDPYTHISRPSGIRKSAAKNA